MTSNSLSKKPPVLGDPQAFRLDSEEKIPSSICVVPSYPLS